MSDEQLTLIKGRTLTEYAEVRNELTALLSEASRLASHLQRVLFYLEPGQYSNTDLKSAANPPDLSDFPTREQLQSVIDEVLAAMERKKTLKEQLQNYGAEPKD